MPSGDQDPINLDPDARKLKENAVDLFYRQNRMDQGIDMIRRALEIDSRIPQAGNMYFIYYALVRKQPDTAIALMEPLVERNPSSAGLRFDLGNTYAMLNRHDLALDSFRRALDLGMEPTASIYLNMGNSFVRSGRPVQAIEAYRKGKVLDRTHLNLRRNLAIALYETGNVKEARAEAHAIINEFPGSDVARWAAQVIQLWK